MVDQEVLEKLTRTEMDMAYKRRVHTIMEWLEPQDEDVILDCGAGRGFYLNFVRALCGARLVGVELDNEIVRKGRRNTAHLDDVLVTQANIYKLPFPDATFDKVILSEILEHIEYDVRGLREVARVLKPGGIVAITVPNANYPFWWDPVNRTLESMIGWHIGRGPLAGIWANHVRLYSRPGLRSTVSSAGLLIEDERSFTHYCLPFSHNLLYGIGKPLIESRFMPESIGRAADRTQFDDNSAPTSRLNPLVWVRALLERIDSLNVMHEPEHRSTVNLCIKGRKPA